MKRRGPARIITAEEALAIYRARDMRKNVAVDFGVSPSTVSMIKSGKRYSDVIAAFRAVEQMNATLATTAFTTEVA